MLRRSASALRLFYDDAMTRGLPTPQTNMPLSRRAREVLTMTNPHEGDGGPPCPHHRIDDPWVGERVDTFLAHHYPSWNKEVTYNLVRSGHIYRMKAHVGKRLTARMDDRLERNDVLVLPAELPVGYNRMIEPKMEHVVESTRPLMSAKVRQLAESWVLFKNQHMIVINKPPGIPVHKTRDGGMNVEDMLGCWKYTNVQRPMMVHALDKETSGCLILARTPSAQRMLHQAHVRRHVPNDVYWALLTSTPKANVGRIRMHMEVTKSPEGGERIIARPAATDKTKVALAEFTINEKIGEYGCWASFYPLTSQRHQLRIMCAHALKSPIFGDARYGGNAAYPSALKAFWDPQDRGLALHLHHRRVQLPYKLESGLHVCIDAPLPEHMARSWDVLGWNKNAADPFVVS